VHYYLAVTKIVVVNYDNLPVKKDMICRIKKPISVSISMVEKTSGK
jgi:hypothetical protein